MSIDILKAETDLHHSTVVGRDGRELKYSIRTTSGTLETPYGVMEWDKDFVTNHTLKRREDFVIIRANGAPTLDETFARINRAAKLGKRVIRHCDAIFGARLKGEDASDESDGACKQSSTNMVFDAELPLAVSDLTEIPQFDVSEDGEGLFWLRISNRFFDLYADNPTMGDGEQKGRIGVFLATETPANAKSDPENIKWQYADALLTPTEAALPGALGELSVRAALLGLKPGATAI